MLSPHACEQVYRCNKPKLGNQIVWNHLELGSLPTDRAGECRAHLPISPLPLDAPSPPKYQIRISLWLRDRESAHAQKRGEGKDKNQSGAEHSGGQCSAFSIPFYWDG